MLGTCVPTQQQQKFDNRMYVACEIWKVTFFLNKPRICTRIYCLQKILGYLNNFWIDWNVGLKFIEIQ